MRNTLYWHDYETFGTDPARDRPCQFAGVRTDEELNIVGEPLVRFCQPCHDVLPDPEACLITNITPQRAQREGVPEPQFIAAIEQELALPGTCGVGYNSIRFDDEVTRYTLYRNFFDPYQREWKSGNSRWDIIDMLRLVRALRPEGIEWPNYDDGAPSFRLEHLSAANGLVHEAAHDALSDVYATIAVARLVREKQPRLYQYVYDHRLKRRVSDLIDPARGQPFLHVSQRLPREHGYTALMLPVSRHPTNANAVIAINLAADPEPLLSLSAEVLSERLFMPREQRPPGQPPLAIKLVHANRCPVVGTPRLLDSASARRLGIELDACERNWHRLHNHEGLPEKMAAIFSAAPGFLSDRDADQRLYDGFLSDSDRHLLPAVRKASAEELSDGFHFQDERYRQLLFQYRARHSPHTLNEEEVARWREFCRRRLVEPGRGFLTISQYLDRITTLEIEHAQAPRQLEILFQLREWAAQLVG